MAVISFSEAKAKKTPLGNVAGRSDDSARITAECLALAEQLIAGEVFEAVAHLPTRDGQILTVRIAGLSTFRQALPA